MENIKQVYYVIAISFIVYFLLSYAYNRLKIQNIERALLTTGGLLLINIKHSIGILLFGLVFYLLFPEYRFLISRIKMPELSVFIPFIVVVIITGLLAFGSLKRRLKNKSETSQYAYKAAWNYFIIRIVFLFSYEFFFRGVLFFSLLEFNGLVTAIIISTLLYVVIHGFDSKNEIIGAIPFGIVLCLFSYYSNSIWIAFLIHITLSFVYEFSMFKHLTLKTKRS